MKKIMFDDKYGLTDAVLNRRKVMTRRVISEKLWNGWRKENWLMPACVSIQQESIRKYMTKHSPLQFGETIAVAQSYFQIYEERARAHDNSVYQWAKANGLDYKKEILFMEELKKTEAYDNKMFVRADLMPHHIRIKSIKVEPLQDISNEDAIYEGITNYKDEHGSFGWTFKQPRDIIQLWATPRDAFEALIDKVSGKGTWESNPWVFAYEFTLID